MLHVRQRLQLYEFFSLLFRYPEAALVEALGAGRLAETAELLGEAAEGANLTPDLETLQEHYTGLFIARPGGVPAPLYGSVYLDEGRLMGASTLQVAECYAGWGLSLGDGGEPADLLSTELEFLYFLVNEEVEALAGRDLERARKATSAQQSFLSTLLLPWLETFRSRLPEDAHPIYAWGARALLGFVRSEAAWLEKLA